MMSRKLEVRVEDDPERVSGRIQDDRDYHTARGADPQPAPTMSFLSIISQVHCLSTAKGSSSATTGPLGSLAVHRLDDGSPLEVAVPVVGRKHGLAMERCPSG